MSAGIVFKAGRFSKWLIETEAALESGNSGAEVPCGSCRGCCRSSMFVHIRPEETRTLARVPKELLFPAPWLPDGHVLMGYGRDGQCPMLLEGNCSIYEDRPQTCRDYDCRVFAATGVAAEGKKQAEITDRVKAWEFEFDSEASRTEHQYLMAVAAFLRDNRELFPSGSIPDFPVQMAILALRVYSVKPGAVPDREAPVAVKKRFANVITKAMKKASAGRENL